MITGRVSPSAHRFRGAATALAIAVSMIGAAGAGRAASGPAPQHGQAAKPSDPPAAQAFALPEPEPASRNTVARARMLECGHQWNNMKRAGTASGTWKDFSRGCLAQR